MKLLTQKAAVVCDHRTGRAILLKNGQDFVRIDGSLVLVDGDPVLNPILGCANIGATIKPCTFTLVVEAGLSGFVTINGKRVCLDTVTGMTDGTPPAGVKYQVADPGQHFVREA